MRKIWRLSYGYLMGMLWLSFGMSTTLARLWALSGCCLDAGKQKGLQIATI